MASVGGVGLFLRDVLARSDFAKDPDNASIPDAEELDSNAGSVFSTRNIDESEITYVYGIPAVGHRNEVPRGVRVHRVHSELGSPGRVAQTPFADVSLSENASGTADAPTASKHTQRVQEYTARPSMRLGGNGNPPTPSTSDPAPSTKLAKHPAQPSTK